MLKSARRECSVDRRRRTGHVFDSSAGWCWRERSRAEHEHRFVSIRPRPETQDDVVRVASHDEGVHSGDELIVAVRLIAARRIKEVKLPVLSRDVAIEARTDEDRCFHSGITQVALGVIPEELDFDRTFVAVKQGT